MRISDWSSDVCSSDLFRLALAQRDLELLPGNGDYILKQRGQPMPEPAPAYRAPAYPAPGYRAPGYGTPAYPSPSYPPAGGASGGGASGGVPAGAPAPAYGDSGRSEERRVGEGVVSTGNSRGSPY